MHLSTWAIVGLVSVTTALNASADERERVEETVPFSAGGHFSVENKNGSITVTTWNESSVRIEAEKVAKNADYLEDIEIEIEGSGDSVNVETIHHRKRNSGKVNYVISVPQEASVTIRTANGSLNIDGIHGQVDAKSVNGSVKIEGVVGAMDVTTTNGSIRAAYERADDGDHRFKTTNGSVRVYLPNDAGGSFEAETVNGRIEVDFPTELTRSSRRHLSGSFGSGSGSWDIKTVNGSVKILPN